MSEKQSYRDADDMPTERAVLEREWKAMRLALSMPRAPVRADLIQCLKCQQFWTGPVDGECPHCNPIGAAAQAAQPEAVGEPIKWTLNGEKTCGYNNWLGETAFGRILITWKGWKETPDACVDEFPGELPHFYGSPDEVKESAEAEFNRRLTLASAPTPEPTSAPTAEPSDAKPSFREPTWKDEPPDWCSPKEEEIWQAGYDSAMASVRSMNRSTQSGPVMHAPSGLTFDTVLAAVNPEDLVSLTPPEPSDAERLDWLEQHDERFYHYDMISCIVGTGFFIGGTGDIAKYSSLREAIDAAIRATKGGKL